MNKCKIYQEKKVNNFRRLLEKRMIVLSRMMKTISNLSNKSHYSYTENDITRLTCALLYQIDITVSKFKVKQNKPISINIPIK
jgi:hypothetical protein